MITPALKSFLQRWLVNTLAVLVAMKLVNGIHYETNTDLLIATLVLGILNAFLRPLLMLLSLPLLIFTLGMFTFVINALLLYFVGQLLQPHFVVKDFRTAFWGAVIISLVSLAVNTLTGAGNARVHFRRGRPTQKQPPTDKSGGDGPIIDV